jgi:AAA15 family ATPase/GTPase
MKIKRVTIANFRGYRNPTTIDFNDLTVFVGRNDVGKSTILEALDLFFNDGKGVIKYDKADINITNEARDYSITVTFCDLPERVVVDATYETNLADEYLLNRDGELEISKNFNGSKCTGTYIRAYHPTNQNCADLHLKKNKELKTIIQNQSIECENTFVNSVMRRAIWQHYRENLQFDLVKIDVTTGDDTKRIWAKLSSFLPQYSLFQSDRQNSDGDKEVQDPLKTAVAQFLQETEIQSVLNDVAEQVEVKLKEVSDRTLEKLREMDPNVADSLNPVIPDSSSLKWADVFKNVSITGDEDIPINKRGSGVKRLILLNFFRAEAERRQQVGGGTGIIYAIEEPETSQHFGNQKILANALIELSQAQNTQVVLTTHSGVVVKKLTYDNLRMISENDDGEKIVSRVQSGLLGYPSLNEVNYIAFGEVTEEYHDELYGFIEKRHWLSDYESGKPQQDYIQEKWDGTKINKKHTLTHYIRDVLHHPENTNNEKYTDADLAQSIAEMREYIETRRNEAVEED